MAGTAAGGTEVPGEPTPMKASLAETAAEIVQSFTPIKKIHQHLCAVVAGSISTRDMTRQVEAHHFCSHQNEEMRQCLIYDGPDSDAKLIGVEYIVSEALFLALPDSEKQLWHSHEYEVKSGVLFMPGVPGPVERQDLEKVCKTYGKTFHFWQVDRGDALPLGLPNLMAALTADGQLDDSLARDVEKRMGVSFASERESRQYMRGPEHGIHPLADSWKSGRGIKAELRETDCVKTAVTTARVFV